ncbi:hypothetical protein ACFQ1I_41450 [Kitasatospora arboriphila]
MAVQDPHRHGQQRRCGRHHLHLHVRRSAGYHTDAAGNTWTYGYDQRGRQTTATDPDAGASTRTYDSDGRLAATTDARGQTITHTYDLLGRPTASYAGTAATRPSSSPPSPTTRSSRDS